MRNGRPRLEMPGQQESFDVEPLRYRCSRERWRGLRRATPCNFLQQFAGDRVEISGYVDEARQAVRTFGDVVTFADDRAVGLRNARSVEDALIDFHHGIIEPAGKAA